MRQVSMHFLELQFDDRFEIQNINNQGDVNSAIVEFSKKINIITDLKFQEVLPL